MFGPKSVSSPCLNRAKNTVINPTSPKQPETSRSRKRKWDKGFRTPPAFSGCSVTWAVWTLGAEGRRFKSDRPDHLETEPLAAIGDLETQLDVYKRSK